MKTKFALLLTTLALALPAFAGNRDAAAFALRANADQSASVGTSNSSDVKYVTVSNGKGGTVIVAQRDNSTATTSIALSKSSKGDSCGSGSCSSCAKR